MADNRELPTDVLQALAYFKETNDLDPMQDCINELEERLEQAKKKIIELIHFARHSENAYIANLLCEIRDDIRL